jgi:hypothetical protein
MGYAAQSSASPDPGTDALARGLGWFSIGLGATELFAPRVLTRALGMEGREGLVRAYGMREIMSGLGILASRNPAPWVWSRVAGDALDIATLTGGLDRENPRKENVGLAMAAVAGITALDVACAQALTEEENRIQPRFPMRDYSDRAGFPRPVDEMWGAARDFEVPKEYRAPELLRPYTPAAAQ